MQCRPDRVIGIAETIGCTRDDAGEAREPVNRPGLTSMEAGKKIERDAHEVRRLGDVDAARWRCEHGEPRRRIDIHMTFVRQRSEADAARDAALASSEPGKARTF